MIVEKIFNKWILFFLFLIPVLGFIFEEPYYITLTTKVVILGVAGIGLNLALGYCGLISFGHAAFFWIRWLCNRNTIFSCFELRNNV